MKDSLILFKHIENPAKWMSVLGDLLNSEALLSVKIDDNTSWSIKPMSVNDKGQLRCLLSVQDKAFSHITLCSVQFTVNGENYYFEGTAAFTAQSVQFSVLHMFHLQKRKNFRFLVPDSHQTYLKLKLPNKAAIMGEFRDISTEGGGADFSKMPDILSLKEYDAEIITHSGVSIPIRIVIKNQRTSAEGMLALGFEFIELDNATENAIISAIANLQRDVFFHLNAS